MYYYYLNDAEQPVGPVSLGQLRNLHHDGVVSDDTSVVPVGSQDWQCYASIVVGDVHSMGGSPPSPPVPQQATVLPEKLTAGKNAGGIWLKWCLMSLITLMMVAGGAWAFQRMRSHQPRGTDSPAQLSQIPTHPMAEWYGFGHAQGVESARAHEELGLPLRPERLQITHLLKNMGVDRRTVTPEAADLCYQGYVDAIEGTPATYGVSVNVSKSVLPDVLLPAPIAGLTSLVARSAANNDKNELEQAVACTVLVQVETRMGEGHGSGFFVAPGVLVTNRHVVEGATSIRVRMADRTLVPGELVAASGTNDVAVVSIKQTDHPVLKLGNSRNVHRGDDLTAIGFPVTEDFSATSTYGRVSSTDRVVRNNRCFQVDLSINHGNSGGPLLDRQGHVIGIITFGFGDYKVDRFNFAIILDDVLPFIKQHCKTKLTVVK